MQAELPPLPQPTDTGAGGVGTPDIFDIEGAEGTGGAGGGVQGGLGIAGTVSTGPARLSNEVNIILTPSTASANQDGVLPVSLQRTAMVETPQQVLWVVIRNRSNAIGWRRYKEFIDGVLCVDPASKVRSASTIAFRGTDAYQILKNATDLFLMHEAGVIDEDFIIDPAFETSLPGAASTPTPRSTRSVPRRIRAGANGPPWRSSAVSAGAPPSIGYESCVTRTTSG